MYSKSGGKVLFTLSLIFLMSAAMFISMTAPASADETVITIWHALPREYDPLFQEIVNTYPSQTSGLVKVVTKRFDSAEEMQKALEAGKNLPDAALVDTRWQDTFVENGSIVIIEDMIKGTAGNSTFVSFKTDTFKPMWESSKYKGKLVSIPFTGYNRAMIVNEDVMETYAIKKRPRLWKDLIPIGKALARARLEKQEAGETVTDQGEFCMILPVEATPEELAEFFQVLMWQAGTDIFDPILNGELANFDSPQGRFILDVLVKMIHKHRVCTPSEAKRANAAMFIGTPGDYQKLVDSGANVKVIRWPGSKRSVNNLVTYSFVVFKGSDKAKTEKIWHTLYEACEFKNGLKWTINTNFLPNNPQIARNPSYFAFVEKYPGVKKFIQQMKNARVSKQSAKRRRAMRILGIYLQNALWGKMEPAAALEESTKKANKALDPTGHLRKKKQEFRAVGDLVDKVW